MKRIPKDGEGGPSQKKIKGSSNDTMVSNDNMVEEWRLRAGEGYDTVFRNKVKNGPILSIGCRGCHKFRNKDCRYPNCRNSASYIKLNSEDYKKIGKYCKQCRGE